MSVSHLSQCADDHSVCALFSLGVWCSIASQKAWMLQNLPNCTEQLVVTMTVENGKWYDTDRLDITIDCVDSPTEECPCPCDRFSDANCSCKDLKDPIRIGLTKTPVNVLYPLESPMIFNGRPYEVSDRPVQKVIIQITPVSAIDFSTCRNIFLLDQEAI